LLWEIVWRIAHRIWRDFGSALPFQTRLTQTNPVIPLSNEHGSEVKEQGRQQCCINKYKNFPIGLNVMYLYFPGTPRTKVLVKICHKSVDIILILSVISARNIKWHYGKHNSYFLNWNIFPHRRSCFYSCEPEAKSVISKFPLVVFLFVLI
jgi:hypothetical protein